MPTFYIFSKYYIYLVIAFQCQIMHYFKFYLVDKLSNLYLFSNCIANYNISNFG